MKELIYSIKSVFDGEEGSILNDKRVCYFIPLYQRGYKWTASEIDKLLTDINNFKYENGKFYCLQNITLVPDNDNKRYNVVDGQQRLTTIAILLSVLNEKELIKDRLLFPEASIRKHTNEFIQQYILNDTQIPDEWQDLLDLNNNYDHQDIYHIFNGYHVIINWLETNDIDKESYKMKLLEHVKFICNIIEGEKEEVVFGNLNSKRVFLDGADLIRAILITNVTKENKTFDSVKNIVTINERRIRIGWKLDNINQWWNRPDVQTYFTPFTRLVSSGDIDFSREKHPINQLFFLYAEQKGWANLSLERIEQIKSTKLFYNEILQLHTLLKNWFNHKEIYHYLGFLFHQSEKRKFSEYHKEWIKCKTISEFVEHLHGWVKKSLLGDIELDELFDSTDDWYSSDKLTPILLFLDIIEVLKHDSKPLDVSSFTKADKDIEHIYPQTPQKVSDKVGYLQYLYNAVPEIQEEFNYDKISEMSEVELDSFIAKYKEKITEHSIGNLVLLDYSLNRSLQNKPYAYKRKKVLNYFNKGNYVQPHTLKVFARYFLDDEEQDIFDGKYWTQADIEANKKKIKENLRKFFI